MAQTTLAAPHPLIIIGGSAGSLDVLLHLLPALRPSFSIPVVIVVHRKNPNDAILPGLLATKTPMLVKEIEEKEKIMPGRIYIVPGDYHVLFEQDYTFSLDYSEKVNFSRPSIDVVYQSAADVFCEKLTCILLSGANADGTDGMLYAQTKGAVTIAQQPSTADVAYMPEHAIMHQAVQYVYDVQQIADYMNNL